MKYKAVFNSKLFLLMVFVVTLRVSINTAIASTVINIQKFGADNTGRQETSAVFQQAINQLYKTGGGAVYIPAGTYMIKYSVFIPSNIKLYGEGKETIIKANISVAEGRCAFLVGDSYEVNYEVINKLRDRNITSWPANSGFKDIGLPAGLDLEASDKWIITHNSSIQNLMIKFDYTGCESNWGGYGIQFSNAANCYAKDIWTENACQAVGIGSDTPPANPACVNVFCYNIHVIKPDPVHTYYAIGFIANSNNCGIVNADSFQACTQGSPDGSLVATNFTKNCIIKNISGNVGQSGTAEGILLNNTYGCKVQNAKITNARAGISVSFTDFNLLLKNKNLNNVFDHVVINDAETGICILSKYTVFRNITLNNCNKTIAYNTNATGNSFIGLGMYLSELPQTARQWLTEYNLIKD